ncbi:hypothetical protein CYK25_008805 [Varibaculum cambriense]|nr:hypothetical protein CYK25_008805 [Varibaculum cambriense]
MANDLSTEITKKWDEAMKLSHAIKDAFDRQAVVIEDYKKEYAALQDMLRRLKAGDKQITFDEASNLVAKMDNLKSLGFRYLKEANDRASDLLQLLGELDELEGK